MESSQKTKTKRPVIVRQTLTSKYRMLKANPLLAYELEKTLPSREIVTPLKTLVTVLDSTLGTSKKSYSSTNYTHLNKTLNSKTRVNEKTNPNHVNVKTAVSQPSKIHTVANRQQKKVSHTENNSSTNRQPTKSLKSACNVTIPSKAHLLNNTLKNETKSNAVLNNSSIAIIQKTETPVITVNDIGSKPPMKSTMTPSAPIQETNIFKTPHKEHCSVLQDVNGSKSVNIFSSNKRNTIHTPSYRRNSTINSKEISKRLSDWLEQKGKKFIDYHHLKCFGVHTPNKQNVKKTLNEQKENVVNNMIVEEDKLNTCNNPEENINVSVVAQGALQDLHKLILEGYAADQCEIWLQLIKQKWNPVVNKPYYWECRAALEQTKGNIQMAVECYKEAIVQGAETQSIDRSLDQLLQKFDILNISNDLNPSSHKEKCKIVNEIRNVFKSSIIGFAVQEKHIKTKNKEGTLIEKQLIATPVRRSTRLSRSAFKSTPGVQIYSSLQDVDEAVRDNLNFQYNAALD